MKHIVLEIFFPGYFWEKFFNLYEYVIIYYEEIKKYVEEKFNLLYFVFNGNGSSNEIFLITFYILYSFYSFYRGISIYFSVRLLLFFYLFIIFYIQRWGKFNEAANNFLDCF